MGDIINRARARSPLVSQSSGVSNASAAAVATRGSNAGGRGGASPVPVSATNTPRLSAVKDRDFRGEDDGEAAAGTTLMDRFASAGITARSDDGHDDAAGTPYHSDEDTTTKKVKASVKASPSGISSIANKSRSDRFKRPQNNRYDNAVSDTTPLLIDEQEAAAVSVKLSASGLPPSGSNKISK